MCGDLVAYTFEKVKSATNETWLSLWADDKKIIVRQAFFQTGDIIEIEIHHNQFVAAIVTKDTDFGTDGENTIVFTD